jgi:hypothetical protein
VQAREWHDWSVPIGGFAMLTIPILILDRGVEAFQNSSSLSSFPAFAHVGGNSSLVNVQHIHTSISCTLFQLYVRHTHVSFHSKRTLRRVDGRVAFFTTTVAKDKLHPYVVDRVENKEMYTRKDHSMNLLIWWMSWRMTETLSAR